ncbi:MAG: ABC transporter ATP-binding protein/permease [Verrucomicrobiae bacterium]|nr:ABC transporter ATP-binding protein/permease [Verrucomicrobiae bacterium]
MHHGIHHHSDLTVEESFKAKPRSTIEIQKRIARYLSPYKWMAIGTVACALLSLAFSFAYPRLTHLLIDEVIGKQRQELLLSSMVLLVLAFLLRDLFNHLRIKINNTLEQNVIFDIRRQLFARLQRLPVCYFDQRASGDLMTRVMEDVTAVERLLIDGVEQGAVVLVSIVGVTVILFWMNPVLAAIAMIPIPLLTAGALLYTFTAHKRYRAHREASSALNALLMDDLQGIRQIKAFAREDYEDDRFARKASDLRNASLKIMYAWAFYSPLMNFFGAIGVVFVLYFGGKQVLANQMTLGELMGFLLYLNLFYEPIGRLHGLNQMLQAARAAGERIFDIMDAKIEAENSSRTARFTSTVRGEVIYENVGFIYPNGRVALENINICAKAGEVVALVGPTGSGKSTLANLLPAFYEPTQGRIMIEGMDISTIQLNELRSKISFVSQEPFLFNGTIRENILYGKPDATEAELINASVSANCHYFIENLPRGYDTYVGERGIRLSVGEKQRVSIARALLKNAPILILDEATASVDTATEKLIQEALQRLMKNRTCFVIAHRLSTIRHADQIIVLRNGRIIERGSHQELIESGGLYATLIKIQNAATIEESFEQLKFAGLIGDNGKE